MKAAEAIKGLVRASSIVEANLCEVSLKTFLAALDAQLLNVGVGKAIKGAWINILQYGGNIGVHCKVQKENG